MFSELNAQYESDRASTEFKMMRIAQNLDKVDPVFNGIDQATESFKHNGYTIYFSSRAVNSKNHDGGINLHVTASMLFMIDTTGKIVTDPQVISNGYQEISKLLDKRFG